jgi:hypothetical protein
MSDATYVWLITHHRGEEFVEAGHTAATRIPDDANGQLVARVASERIRAGHRKTGWNGHNAVVRARSFSEALSKVPLLAPDGVTLSINDVDSIEDLSPIDDRPLGQSFVREWREQARTR